MTRHIFCRKLQQEAVGLEVSPYPGAIGERIYNEISQQAWQMWLERQTMLINEYRLSMLDSKARSFLLDEMQKFLFGTEEESLTPPGYQPLDKA